MQYSLGAPWLAGYPHLLRLEAVPSGKVEALDSRPVFEASSFTAALKTSPAGGDLQWGGGAYVCCPLALRICLQAMSLVFHVNMSRLRTPPCWPGPTEAAFDAAVFWYLACCVTLGFGYLPTDLGRGSSHHWQPWSSWQACWPLLCINLRLGMLGLWEVFGPCKRQTRMEHLLVPSLDLHVLPTWICFHSPVLGKSYPRKHYPPRVPKCPLLLAFPLGCLTGPPKVESFGEEGQDAHS